MRPTTIQATAKRDPEEIVVIGKPNDMQPRNPARMMTGGSGMPDNWFTLIPVSTRKVSKANHSSNANNTRIARSPTGPKAARARAPIVQLLDGISGLRSAALSNDLPKSKAVYQFKPATKARHRHALYPANRKPKGTVKMPAPTKQFIMLKIVCCKLVRCCICPSCSLASGAFSSAAMGGGGCSLAIADAMGNSKMKRCW
mmetsp:Transcript_108595/g.171373  ORF Transcript_108595/g.171373 Transcript_108595/m.171373 type:complete len:200 (-) Transcript_108595:16-615(-)